MIAVARHTTPTAAVTELATDFGTVMSNFLRLRRLFPSARQRRTPPPAQPITSNPSKEFGNYLARTRRYSVISEFGSEADHSRRSKSRRRTVGLHPKKPGGFRHRVLFVCASRSPQASSSMPLSSARLRMRACNFSKARTSIWRMRSRLTSYWPLSSSSVMV